jgi:hypothetical protein
MATKSDLISSASLVNAPMTSVKLNGKNYVYWARFVKVFLRGKGTYHHLTLGKPSNSSSTSLWRQD